MMISEHRVSNYNPSNFSELEESLRKAEAAAQASSTDFFADFFESQVGDRGVAATGVCAGMVIWGFKFVELTKHNVIPPILPKQVPAEAVHLEMQLPRAIMRVIPRSVDAASIKRGCGTENDKLINKILKTFQIFILQEANVGIETVLPGPDFNHHVQQQQFNEFVTQLDNNGQYLFSVQKSGQLVTEGHAFYVNLTRGIILDAGFGGFIWQIDRKAHDQFKAILISYLNRNYPNFDLFACKLKLLPSTFYSKFPLSVRVAASRTELLSNLTMYLALRKEWRAIKMLLPTRRSIRKKNYDAFNQKLTCWEGNKNLLEAIKEVGKLAINYRIFGSSDTLDLNNFIVMSFPEDRDYDWNELFHVIDGLDKRLVSLISQLEGELLEKICIRICKQFKKELEREIDMQSFLLLVVQFLKRREQLKEKYDLNRYVSLIANYHLQAEELLSLFLQYGASPEGSHYDFQTPLARACQEEDEKIAALLVRYGASFFQKRGKGNNAKEPYSILSKKGTTEKIKAIRKLMHASNPFPVITIM